MKEPGNRVFRFCLALLRPLAFAFEPGGELLRPMAAAAFGGLLTETLVTLCLAPVLYRLISARDEAR